MPRDETLTLPDGRLLTYAEFGDPGGRPLMYFHGAPSCRLEPGLIGDDVLRAARVRLVAADRPGMGGSTFQPGRGFGDWPQDVSHLADALGWPTFAVLGNSGGAAYAAACAARIPERLTSAVIVSGAWRMDAPEVATQLPFLNRLVWTLARRFPPGLRLLLSTMRGGSQRTLDEELASMQRFLPAADLAAFAAPGRLSVMQATVREALRSGTRGAAWDMQCHVRPFDFALSDIRVPLRLFHGSDDRNVPLALVQATLPSLPGAELVVFAGEAHLSTLSGHIAEILAAAI